MTRVRPDILDTVARALPCDIGLTPREVNARLPDLPRRTVYDALLLLCRARRARFTGDMNARRYFSEGSPL